MIDPYGMLSSICEGMRFGAVSDPVGETDDGDEASAWHTAMPWHQRAGAHDSWPWRPAAPWQPHPGGGGCGALPPPCPLHAPGSRRSFDGAWPVPPWLGVR